MRLCTFALLAAAGLCHPGLASAVVYPPNTLLSGEVGQTVVSNQCYIVRGSSDFLRNGAANRAYLSVADMVAAGYELNGQMILVFTSATGGTARFNFATTYPSNVQVAPFAGYGQSYDAATKTFRAHFTINFPGCSLLVSGVYRSP
jgi:hypothetical protein